MEIVRFDLGLKRKGAQVCLEWEKGILGWGQGSDKDVIVGKDIVNENNRRQ